MDIQTVTYKFDFFKLMKTVLILGAVKCIFPKFTGNSFQHPIAILHTRYDLIFTATNNQVNVKLTHYREYTFPMKP